MGGAQSVHNTPLACMLKNFDSYFKSKYPSVTKERLKLLCKHVWPTMGTGWPPQGSLDEEVADALWGEIVGNPRKYPDQLPYIEQWVNVLTEKADELLQCQAGAVKVCVIRQGPRGLKVCAEKEHRRGKARFVTRRTVHSEDPEEELRPLPCAPPLPPPPQYQAQAVGGDMAGGDAVAVGKDLGARSKIKGSLSIGDSMPGGDSLPQAEGAQTRAMKKRAEAALLEEVDKAELLDPEVDKAELLAPLRQVDQQVINQQGEAEYRPLFQYVPFTTTDLLNWKQHYGPLSSKPTEMADLFKTIMLTHNPTWQDVQQLLNALLTPEEREKWKGAVRKCVKARYPDRPDISADLLRLSPESDPLWNHRSPDDRNKLKDYQSLVVEAMRSAGKPPVNMSKPSLIMQSADESPEGFLQRLIEAYELYTQVDPRAPENVRMLNERFIAQSYEDIRRKLQKTEGALGKNTTELLEIARKVFANREKVEKKERDARMHKKTELLAVALQGGRVIGPNQGTALGQNQFLGQNQCAYCREEGHWQRECPRRRMMRGRGGLRRPEGRQYSGFGGQRGMVSNRFAGRGGQFQRGGRGFGRGYGGSVMSGERNPAAETVGLAEMGWSD